MLFIFTSTLLFTALSGGLGVLCAPLLPSPAGEGMGNPWLRPFLGMILAGVFAMAASLLMPLSPRVSVIFALAGAAGMPAWLRELRTDGKKRGKMALWTFYLVLVGTFMVLLTNLSYLHWVGSAAYDTDLYHANILRWMNEYGTPPGLANLHSRLGCASIWHSLAALVDNGPWDNSSAWIMPALAFFCTLTWLLHEAFFSGRAVTRIFCLLMLPFLSAKVFTLPNLNYDIPALILNIMLIKECLDAFWAGPDDMPARATLIVSLAAASFMVKPMTAVSVCFAAATAFFLLKKHNALSPAALVRVFGLATIGGVVWVAKNCLLSGWPLFPLPYFSLPVDWAAPADMVAAIHNAVMSWARNPGHHASLRDWSWIGPWLERHLHYRLFWWTVLLPMVAALPLWIGLARKKARLPLFLAIWMLACIIYWFCTAPDLRFGGMIFFYMLFALGAAFTFDRVQPPAILSRIAQRPKMAATLLAMLFILTASYTLVKVGLDPKRSLLGIGTVPARELSSRVLDDSVTPPVYLYFAKPGDDRCGNSPLPCAPYDNPRLTLRAPGDIGSGFRLNP